jgi:hypothetical protein
MSDVADENRRMVVTSINRYLAMEPLAMLVPGLDHDMSNWLAANGCNRKAAIFWGTFVMFPDVPTQIAFKMRFGVGARSVE